jgi:hypothetical protein
MQAAVLSPTFVQAPPRISSKAHAQPVGRRWVWPVTFFLVITLTLALLVYGITGFFRLGRDARALRNSFLESEAVTPGAWNKTIELSIGRLTCFAVRTGVSFFPIDPTALTALGVVQGAEVGVYRAPRGTGKTSAASLLANADAAMAKRGWEPLVKVLNRSESVLIYTPQNAQSGSSIRVCLAVLQRDQLVVVSARANAEALMQLAVAAQDKSGGLTVPGFSHSPHLRFPKFEAARF